MSDDLLKAMEEMTKMMDQETEQPRYVFAPQQTVFAVTGKWLEPGRYATEGGGWVEVTPSGPPRPQAPDAE